jgi:hypothetical protein
MFGHACGCSFAQPEIAINLFDCDGVLRLPHAWTLP